MEKSIKLIPLFLTMLYCELSIGCNYCEVPHAYANEDILVMNADSIFIVRVQCEDGKPHFFMEKILKGKKEELSEGDELRLYDKNGGEILFCDKMLHFTLKPLDGRLILMANRMENGTFRIAHGTKCSFWPVNWEKRMDGVLNADSLAISSRNAKEERRRCELFVDAMVRYEKAAEEGIDQCFESIGRDMDNNEMLNYAIRYVSSPYSIFDKQGNERERILIAFIAFKHLEHLQRLEHFSFQDVERMDRICSCLPWSLIVKYRLWRLRAMLNDKLEIREVFMAGEFVMPLFDLVEKECPEFNAMSKGHLVNLRKQWTDHVNKHEEMPMMGKMKIFNLDKEICNEILAQCTAELCKNWTARDESDFFKYRKLDALDKECYKDILIKMKDEILRKPEVIENKK